MSKHTRLLLAFSSLAFLAAASARAETLEAVEKKLAEQSKKNTAMSMKMKTVSEISGEGFKSKSTIDGHYEYMIDGKKTLTRVEVANKTSIEAGGTKQDMDSKSLSISDGEFTWILSEQAGQKNVMKLKFDDKQATNGHDGMKEWYHIKLLPDETVDGKPCYVLDMKPKKIVAGDMQQRIVHYYQKDICVLVKAVSFGENQKPISNTTYTDIKINPTLDKSRFKFTPPPGVPVMDMSKNADLKQPADGE